MPKFGARPGRDSAWDRSRSVQQNKSDKEGVEEGVALPPEAAPSAAPQQPPSAGEPPQGDEEARHEKQTPPPTSYRSYREVVVYGTGGVDNNEWTGIGGFPGGNRAIATARVEIKEELSEEDRRFIERAIAGSLLDDDLRMGNDVRGSGAVRDDYSSDEEEENTEGNHTRQPLTIRTPRQTGELPTLTEEENDDESYAVAGHGATPSEEEIGGGFPESDLLPGLVPTGNQGRNAHNALHPEGVAGHGAPAPSAQEAEPSPSPTGRPLPSIAPTPLPIQFIKEGGEQDSSDGEGDDADREPAVAGAGAGGNPGLTIRTPGEEDSVRRQDVFIIFNHKGGQVELLAVDASDPNHSRTFHIFLKTEQQVADIHRMDLDPPSVVPKDELPEFVQEKVLDILRQRELGNVEGDHEAEGPNELPAEAGEGFFWEAFNAIREALGCPRREDSGARPTEDDSDEEDEEGTPAGGGGVQPLADGVTPGEQQDGDEEEESDPAGNREEEGAGTPRTPELPSASPTTSPLPVPSATPDPTSASEGDQQNATTSLPPVDLTTLLVGVTVVGHDGSAQ